MTMVDAGEPRTVGGAVVQYVTDKSHAHEGGHRIALAPFEVLVLPDGRTTAKKRSHVISRVLAGNLADEWALKTLVGALVLAGATNITIDGLPVLGDDTTPILSVRLDITQQDDRTLAVSVATLGAGA